MNELFEKRRIQLQDALIKAALDLSEHMGCDEFEMPMPTEGYVLKLVREGEDD